jgi:hypothetical protein
VDLELAGRVDHDRHGILWGLAHEVELEGRRTGVRVRLHRGLDILGRCARHEHPEVDGTTGQGEAQGFG